MDSRDTKIGVIITNSNKVLSIMDSNNKDTHMVQEVNNRLKEI